MSTKFNKLEVDLDINNYKLNDILHLFKIPSDFQEADLKKAKYTMLMIHPDKSHLPPQYFRFYSDAYKILLSVWEFRSKREVDLKNANINYDSTTMNDTNKEILDTFFTQNELLKKNNNKFNEWFNKEFDKRKLDNENVDTGYGDWLKSNDGLEEKHVGSLSEMNDVFHKRKSEARSLVLRQDILDFSRNNNMNICELSNSTPTSYRSDMGSSLHYEDIRQAHSSTSVIPVTEEDFYNRQKFNSVDDMIQHRTRQEVDVGMGMSESQALEYLNNKEQTATKQATQLGFEFAIQAEQLRKKDEDFWSNMRRINN